VCCVRCCVPWGCSCSGGSKGCQNVIASKLQCDLQTLGGKHGAQYHECGSRSYAAMHEYSPINLLSSCKFFICMLCLPLAGTQLSTFGRFWPLHAKAPIAHPGYSSSLVSQPCAPVHTDHKCRSFTTTKLSIERCGQHGIGSAITELRLCSYLPHFALPTNLVRVSRPSRPSFSALNQPASQQVRKKSGGAMRNCTREPYILRASSLVKCIVSQEASSRIFSEKRWQNLDHVVVELHLGNCQLICNHLYNGSETCTLTYSTLTIIANKETLKLQNKHTRREGPNLELYYDQQCLIGLVSA
jgi:hypothetical protein